MVLNSAMTLDEFFKSPATTITKADLASVLNVSQITVNRWIAGTRFPEKEMVLAVEEATGGRVQPADWYRRSLPAPSHREDAA
jgi:DNA-binding transcriptional regulator YdaS (Cro superfamily)